MTTINHDDTAAAIKDAFKRGVRRGRTWVGPNGDGSFGSGSAAFINKDEELADDNGWIVDEAVAKAFWRGFRTTNGR